MGFVMTTGAGESLAEVVEDFVASILAQRTPGKRVEESPRLEKKAMKERRSGELFFGEESEIFFMGGAILGAGCGQVNARAFCIAWADRAGRREWN